MANPFCLVDIFHITTGIHRMQFTKTRHLLRFDTLEGLWELGLVNAVYLGKDNACIENF